MNLQKGSLQPAEILVVEDEEQDIRFIRRGFEKSKLINNLHVVTDGEEALKFLRREGDYADAVRPDLVLLDLKLPKLDGHEVLKEIKEDDDLKRIPVAMLTSSEAEKDVVKSYNWGANCYIKKPVGLDEINEVINVVSDFWFCVVKLAPR